MLTACLQAQVLRPQLIYHSSISTQCPVRLHIVTVTAVDAIFDLVPSLGCLLKHTMMLCSICSASQNSRLRMCRLLTSNGSGAEQPSTVTLHLSLYRPPLLRGVLKDEEHRKMSLISALDILMKSCRF